MEGYLQKDAQLSEDDRLIDSLVKAVEQGRMTREESEECLYAYMQAKSRVAS